MCNRLCVFVWKRRSWGESAGNSVKFSSECQPLIHWCFLWQQISSFKPDDLSERHLFLPDLNFLHPSLCTGWCFSIHAAGSVLYCRCQIEEDGCQSWSSSSPALSLNLSPTPRPLSLILSFCPSTHLHHPSSVLSFKTQTTHFFSANDSVFYIPKGQISYIEVDCHSWNHRSKKEAEKC